ncbi:MAG TPA: S9 family peptidase [Polaromonas sp.]|uniref:S9 family peptidase n=1 Tax=Polaromonas sp. TaxID=1869339 RepID=UPI002D546AC8|nr:S9 family peptidase [Polaromonas sp.]HYW56115.1 S9 family peptidase [Polaromonas sp.]
MKPFTADDLYEQKKLIDLHGLAGHTKSFGTVRSVNRKDNTYSTQIWRFEALTKTAEPATPGDGSDNSPRLSPDGMTLAFLSNRGGDNTQLHLLALDSGEAKQLGNFASGVSSLRWASDSQSLILAVPTSVSPDVRGKRGKSPETQSESDPEVCWKLPYKSDGVGYLLKREIHLFRIGVNTRQTEQITDGPFDVLAFEPSQDGKHIAYVRARDGKYAHLSDLWICDAEGKNHRQVTHDVSTVMQPSWAPDSQSLAYAGARKAGDSEARLWILDLKTGMSRCVGGDAVEVAHPESLCWDEDDQKIYLVRAWRGRHELVSVGVQDGDIDVLLTGPRQIGAMSPMADGYAFSSQSPDAPEELFYKSFEGGQKLQLSNLNSWWASRSAIEMSERTFEVPDGKGGLEKIHGWLLRGTDTPKGQPSPLLDDIHGGPGSYALLDYDTNVYWQAMCSRGWTILLLNAVGSSSYGEDFRTRLAGKWGAWTFRSIWRPSNNCRLKAFATTGCA